MGDRMSRVVELLEARSRPEFSVGSWLESRMESALVVAVNEIYGQGDISREERRILREAVAKALDTFTGHTAEHLPGLYGTEVGEAVADAELQEPFPNEHAARVRDPGDFEEGSFRSKAITAGVRIIVGKLKGQSAMTTQSYRFAADRFTPEQAKSWLESHEVKYKGLEKATGKATESEKIEMPSDFMPLVESSVRADGTIPIKIIQPGWGSSGYYPASVLERDGPRVFVAGTKMFWDHATQEEETQRPEGSLRNLAAELVSSARWVNEHPAGAGLYADAKVFEPFRPAVDELAPHIGVSVRALGRGESGNVEGRAGRIITEITSARSIDFVTSPGAGGKILQLFEAQRNAGDTSLEKEIIHMEDETKKLQEANAALEKQLKEQAELMATLRRSAALREASEFVAVALAKEDLPAPTKARLSRDLPKDPPVKDGKLDEAGMTDRINEAVKAERDYLAEITKVGEIKGMGSGDEDETANSPDLEAQFRRLGLSESIAKQAATGRK